MLDQFKKEILLYLTNNKNRINNNDIIYSTLTKEIIELLDNSDIYYNAYIFSSLYEKIYLKDNKEKAAFYTNLDIAYEMVKLSFKNIKKENNNNLNNLKILDPCVWSWIFIFAIMKYLSNDLWLKELDIKKYIISNIFTTDIDKETTDFFLFLMENMFNINFKNNHKLISFFDIKNKNYDIIIWNPPYWLSLKNEKEIIFKELNKENKIDIKESDISNDSYWLFYIHAFNLLNENGNITFITPNSFLNIKQHYWLRKYLIDYFDTFILLNDNVFKNKITNLKPWVETLICKIVKDNWENNTFQIINNKDKIYSNNEHYIIDYNIYKEFKKSDIKQIYHIPVSYYIDDEIIDIMTNKKYKKISDYFDSAMWIKTADNKLYTSDKKDDNYIDIFIKWTSKDPQEYEYIYHDYINFSKLVENKPLNSNIPNRKFLNKNLYKIWIPEIWHKWIICAFKYKEELVSNSIWIYILKDRYYNIKLLDRCINLFNSELYKKISKIYSNNIRLEKHTIDNLPLILDI